MNRHILNLLVCEDLVTGKSRISRLRVGSESLAQYLFVFLVETKGFELVESVIVGLMLEDRLPSGKITEEVASVLRESAETKGGRREILIVLPEGEQEDSLRAALPEAKAITPERFYRGLVQLPDDLLAQILSNRSESVDYELFEKALSRGAYLLSRPGETSRGESIPNLNEYLVDWSRVGSVRYPILLLGERGAGKSWQLLSFCQAQLRAHEEKPWTYGVPFYVSLSDLMGESGTGVRPFAPVSHYLSKNYAPLSFLHDASMASSLLANGHLILCMDGLDEIEHQADDSRVRIHLSTLAGMVSSSARLLVTSRTSHFNSLSELRRMQVWSGACVGDAFEILSLAPLSSREALAYLDEISPAVGGPAEEKLTSNRKWNELLCREPRMAPALEAVVRHPGILGFVGSRLSSGVWGEQRGIDVLREAIEDSFILFNLRRGRTTPYFLDDQGDLLDMSEGVRLEVLEEIAWYMAERCLDVLDFRRLPGRIVKLFHLEGEAERRDIRSQLVFELVEQESSEASPVDRSLKAGAGTIARVKEEGAVRFALRIEGGAANLGSSSVSGAYFLAKYVFRRLRERSPKGELLSVEQRVRPLGRVLLGETAATLLAEMLMMEGGAADLTSEVEELLLGAASRGSLEIYSPWYRYLVKNLVEMGLMNPSMQERLDPWTSEVLSIIRAPELFPDYEMVLVPPSAESGSPGRPFLVGAHEITNELFERFVNESREGESWSVKAMTLAGGEGERPKSRFSDLANEYHLYFWNTRRTKSNGSFKPDPLEVRKPVTYVSWFAAAAFCDWMTRNDRVGCERYGVERKPDRALEPKQSSTGFRLPTSDEWTWTAKGGHEDLEYPWEMYPYYLPKSERVAVVQAVDTGVSKGIDRGRAEQYVLYQRAVEAVLRRRAKAIEEVLYDEFNDFGVSGMMGNVKEWCEDHPVNKTGTHRLILGATGFLGVNSFKFNYKTPLFPENTNPDVGFRVARSLSNEELAVLELRRAAVGGFRR